MSIIAAVHTEGWHQPLTTRIRTVIVEDEPLYRELLQRALSTYPDIQVVGTFADAATAAEELPSLTPQAVLLDIQFPDGPNGIQLGLELREVLPNLGIVLLSNYRDPAFLTAIPSKDIAGWSYLLKKSVGDLGTLYRAVRGSVRGEIVLDPLLTSNPAARRNKCLADLTNREYDILQRIAQGYSNATIAEQLFLSPRTVENRIRHLYQRLGIDTSSPSFQPRVLAVLKYLHALQASGEA